MEISFIAADYLKGKEIYPTARRFFSLLFIVSIASYIFERTYFPYSWPDLTNYKLILDFFIKGYFIVPFCLFLLVYGITYAIPWVFLTLFNYYKSKKFLRRIVKYELQKDEIDKYARFITRVSKRVAPVHLNRDMLVDLYINIKDYLTPEQIEEIQASFTKEQKTIEVNFIFIFRAIVTSIVYFTVIPHFGWSLLVISLVTMVGYMILLVIGYRLLDIIPTAIQQYRHAADEYVNSYIEQKNAQQRSIE